MKSRKPGDNPYRQKRETLADFNARRAKENASGMPLRGFKQIASVGPPDFQKIVAAAGSFTYACYDCKDIGWIVRDTPKGSYSRRCSCKSNTYADLKPPHDDGIPI